MSFVKLSDALKNTVATKFRDDPVAYASFVIVVAQKVLTSLFDLEQVEDQIKPVTFDDGILTFEVASGVQAHYFKLRSKEIIIEINSQIGEMKITEVRFRQRSPGSILKP